MTDAELETYRRDVSLLRSLVEQQTTTKLRRESGGWKTACPFHGEKKGSFHVYDDGHFHCFGCRANGTVFDFVMRRDKVEFAEAIKIVEAESGISSTKQKSKPAPNGNGHEEWFPMVPPPNAPKPADRHFEKYLPPYEYVDANGRLLFYQRRLEQGGDKKFHQLTYGTLTKNGRSVTDWHSKGPAQPFPLYRLDRIMQANPDTMIIVVEGEKAVAAAERLFPNAIVTTWLNGAGSVALTDWEPLRRFKTVIWWQDADRPRQQPHGCFLATPAFLGLFPNARLVGTSGLEVIKDGYDAADLEAENCDDPDAWLQARLSPIGAVPGNRPDLADCLPFRWSSALTPILDTQDFVEGVLTKGCLAVVYGDSGVGKSFWVLDLLLHIAAGIVWNGREVEQGIAILIAIEGGPMIDNRVIAARERLGLPPSVPLMVVQCPVDLRTNSVDAERLINTIRWAISESPLPVLLVAIDTMSRALNGGSEGAEEMSALLANVDKVRHETRVAILFVAHCGKDAAKGIRGWSGVRAAIDVEIETSKRADGVGSVSEVTKERDLLTGARFNFRLDPVEMGRNQRGKPVMTCVVVPMTDDAGAAPVRLSGDKARAYEVLANTIISRGTAGAVGVPHGFHSVPEEDWREAFYGSAKPGVSQSAKRKAFQRASDALINDLHLVGMANARVWMPRNREDHSDNVAGQTGGT